MQSTIGRAPLVALLAAVALASTGCGEPDGDAPVADATRPEPGVGDATTPAVTDEADDAQPSPTGTLGDPTAEPTPTGSLKDLLVAPQEPVTVPPGEEATFEVPQRLGGQPLPSELGLGYVPCQAVDATASEVVFPAQDGAEPTAARMGESDTGAARLVRVNGETIAVEELPTVVPVEDGTLTFTLVAPRSDCAVPVVFIDEDGDGQLDLQDDLTPAEVYGLGKVEWR